MEWFRNKFRDLRHAVAVTGYHGLNLQSVYGTAKNNRLRLQHSAYLVADRHQLHELPEYAQIRQERGCVREIPAYFDSDFRFWTSSWLRRRLIYLSNHSILSYRKFISDLIPSNAIFIRSLLVGSMLIFIIFI